MPTSELPLTGVLEVLAGGQGAIRDPARHLRAHPLDPRVGAKLIEAADLRPGALLGYRLLPDVTPPGVAEVISVDGLDLEAHRGSTRFEELTAVDPRKKVTLETPGGPLGPRVLDLLAPIGRGQRGLIVAPPKSGKTILLHQIAKALRVNHPEIQVMVLLVDERPEEVTEARRALPPAAVLASSNDGGIDEHIRIAELAVARGRRIAERGGDALILLDSLTRLARAYNARSTSGRTLSGGVDLRALEAPKRLFGSARAFDEGGTLTIMATCLIETGSRMDDVIFQEFKGTGNLEVVLDRALADRRSWPAIDPTQTGTRREERLLDPETLRLVGLMRRTLAGRKVVEAGESLLGRLAKAPDNAAFLRSLSGGAAI